MRICNFNASPTCRSTATPSRRSRPSSTLLPSHSRPPLLLLGPFTSPSPPMERYNAPRQPLTRNNPIRQTELSASPFFISFFSLNSSFSTLDSSLFSLSLSLLLLYTVLPVTVGIVELSGWFRWNRVWGYCLSGIGNVAFQRSMKVLERSHRLRRISCTSYFKRAKCVINLLFIISQVWISRSFPNKWKRLI